MTNDTIFSEQQKIKDFRFNKEVATVFEDMVSRSVPFYQEIQRMVIEQSKNYAQEGSKLYDLGCATGTTLDALDAEIISSVAFVGIDNSPDMLRRYCDKLSVGEHNQIPELICADLNGPLHITDASVVLLILTLQFIRPLNRKDLLTTICNGLRQGGCLLLVEKVLENDTQLNRDFIEYYYNMKKRHNYSELEIEQKRKALENVLIPYTLSENIQLLTDTGFSSVSVFFKWYNFCGLVAIK